MLKKTITYPDLDGNPVTEDFYFNLSKAEIAEMELSHKGGFSGYLRKIIEDEDGAAIISTFNDILLMSIGRRSEDGKRFVKSDEIRDEFMQTEAYSQLFMEMVTDSSAAASFVESIVPSDMKEALAKGQPMTDVKLPEADQEPKDDRPAWIREDRDPTQAEFAEMSREEMQEAFRRKTIRNNQ